MATARIPRLPRTAPLPIRASAGEIIAARLALKAPGALTTLAEIVAARLATVEAALARPALPEEEREEVLGKVVEIRLALQHLGLLVPTSADPEPSTSETP